MCVDSATSRHQLREPAQALHLTEPFPPGPHCATETHQTCRCRVLTFIISITGGLPNSNFVTEYEELTLNDASACRPVTSGEDLAVRDETGFPTTAHQADCPNTSLLREEQVNKLGSTQPIQVHVHLISNYNNKIQLNFGEKQ